MSFGTYGAALYNGYLPRKMTLWRLECVRGNPSAVRGGTEMELLFAVDTVSVWYNAA